MDCVRLEVFRFSSLQNVVNQPMHLPIHAATAPADAVQKLPEGPGSAVAYVVEMVCDYKVCILHANLRRSRTVDVSVNARGKHT